MSSSKTNVSFLRNSIFNKKQDYEKNGNTSFPKYFSKDFIDQINNEIDILHKKLVPNEEVFVDIDPNDQNNQKIKQIQYLWKYGLIFEKMLDNIKLLACELLNLDKNDFHVLNMQLFEKHPNISKPTRNHQDNAYFKLTPGKAATFWISLDNIDEENGCLYYPPYFENKTYEHQRYNKGTTFRLRSGVPGLSLCLPPSSGLPSQSNENQTTEENDIAMYTEPGDLLVHNCNMIHRAGNNKSKDRRRRAIGIVIIPNECRIDPELEEQHNKRLREDIELQKNKEELKEKFAYLYN